MIVRSLEPPRVGVLNLDRAGAHHPGEVPPLFSISFVSPAKKGGGVGQSPRRKKEGVVFSSARFFPRPAAGVSLGFAIEKEGVSVSAELDAAFDRPGGERVAAVVQAPVRHPGSA